MCWSNYVMLVFGCCGVSVCFGLCSIGVVGVMVICVCLIVSVVV